RITAPASGRESPGAWQEQLAEGGLVGVPLRLGPSAGLQLIPTLRREGDRLRSASVICGGFMPLRGGPDDLTPFWPMINVTRVDGAKQDGLLTIAGPATGASARRLVSLATSEPRSRPPPLPASPHA